MKRTYFLIVLCVLTFVWGCTPGGLETNEVNTSLPDGVEPQIDAAGGGAASGDQDAVGDNEGASQLPGNRIIGLQMVPGARAQVEAAPILDKGNISLIQPPASGEPDDSNISKLRLRPEVANVWEKKQFPQYRGLKKVRSIITFPHEPSFEKDSYLVEDHQYSYEKNHTIVFMDRSELLAHADASGEVMKPKGWQRQDFYFDDDGELTRFTLNPYVMENGVRSYVAYPSDDQADELDYGLEVVFQTDDQLSGVRLKEITVIVKEYGVEKYKYVADIIGGASRSGDVLQKTAFVEGLPQRTSNVTRFIWDAGQSKWVPQSEKISVLMYNDAGDPNGVFRPYYYSKGNESLLLDYQAKIIERTMGAFEWAKPFDGVEGVPDNAGLGVYKKEMDDQGEIVKEWYSSSLPQYYFPDNWHESGWHTFEYDLFPTKPLLPPPLLSNGNLVEHTSVFYLQDDTIDRMTEPEGLGLVVPDWGF